MIPDEAVEAAAKFMLDDNPFNDEAGLWEVPSIRDHYREAARGALEAALPYLSEAARQPQRNSPTDWPNIPRAEA